MKKTNFVLILLLVIFGGVIAYFGFNYHPQPAASTGAFSVDSAGKVIETSDRKITLEIPPYGLINQTDISITQIQNTEKSNYTLISTYQFGPEGTQFLTPATLKVVYDLDTLPKGVDQNKLRLFTQVDAGFGQLVNSSVDTTNHLVYGQVSHFSTIYLAASKSQPEPKNFPIVGKWDRIDGVDKYTFRNGGMEGGPTQTIINGEPYFGRWKQDNSNSNKYTLTWDFGPPNPTKGNFVDYITIASDGKTYVGVNNYGSSINCVRVDQDKAPNAIIKQPFPLNKVEKEITIYSISHDQDDPDNMLKYSWVVTSPKGNVVDTIQREPKQITFTPHNVGDYVVWLKVDDGTLSNCDSIILTITPNVKFYPYELSYPPGDLGRPNEVFILWTVENYGEEPVTVVPYFNFTVEINGDIFQKGPYTMKYSTPIVIRGADPEHSVLFGEDAAGGGFIPFPYPEDRDKAVLWEIKEVLWNADLTVNGQTTRYADPPWATPKIVPIEDFVTVFAPIAGS